MKAILFLFSFAALASANQILLPDANYVSGTSLVSFTDPDESLINSITNGTLTINFSSSMRASTVGDDWNTWGSPPNTESATPRVLWSELDANFNPITTVTFNLSTPVSIFGFEAEPDATDVHSLTATFYLGTTLEATITQNVSGNAGALLFAEAAPPGVNFDSVTLTSDVDWAAGQFRYAPAQMASTPEPQTWLLDGIGLFVLLVLSRKINYEIHKGN